MATTLTVQTASLGGLELTNNAADAAGNNLPNNGRTFVLLQNGDSSPTTATFVTSGTATSEALAIADMAVVVTNAKDELVGPFPTDTFGTTLNITYSSVTSLTVDAFKLAD